MVRVCVFGVLALLAGFGGRSVGGEVESAERLVARLKGSLDAIKTVEGTYRTYVSPKTAGSDSIEPNGRPLVGAIAGPGSLVLTSKYDWVWQGAPYREAIDGDDCNIRGDLLHYARTATVFDGQVVRSFDSDSHWGQIQAMVFPRRNPLTLIGVGFGMEPRRNLDAILQGARLVDLPDTAPHLKVLESDFREAGQERTVTVWLDSRCGYLPRRIEVFEKATHFGLGVFVNDDIQEVAPGVWLGLRGSETYFYVADLRLPGGLNKDQVEALGRDAGLALLEKAVRIAKPLGLGTYTYIVDRPTLHVNRAIARERFVLNYPEGTTLYDPTHNPPLHYPSKARRTDDEWRETVARELRRAKPDTRRRDAAHQATLGKPAAEFPEDAVWINSKPLKRSDLAGKRVLLHFWAEWSGPCRIDLASLADLHRKRVENGITVIGIHSPGSDREAINKVIDEFRLEYPIMIDAPTTSDFAIWGRCFRQYAVDAVPHAVLIDQGGRIVASGRSAEVLAKAPRFP